MRIEARKPGQRATVPALPRSDDRVIQGRNNYETGIMNGDVGRVVALDGGNVLVQFDTACVWYSPSLRIEDRLALAYALTIHRSQGSEFPCAIVLDHNSHRYLLNRNLLYVGASRAKTTAILIGSRSTLENAAFRADSTRRQTLLSILALGGTPHGSTVLE
jgi:exodeoxyribonuclease V alpha subunit